MRRWTLYTSVVMPQVIARIIPPMTNQAISITKDTSQVAAIAVMDMMKVAQVWVESSANTYDVFLGVAIIYLVLTSVASASRQAVRAQARLRAMKEFAPLLHGYWYLFRGAGMTLLMAASAIVPATLCGILLALAQVFGNRFARSAVVAYLFVIRGIPLLVLLTFTYYLLPLTGIDLPPFWGVVVVLSLYYAAFMSEVFRAGILSLPRAQWDAARSLGMTRQLMLHIVIFPQALRLASPPFVSLCANLVKATSLVSVVGLWELTMASREIVERTLAPFQIFIGAAAIYFCICYTLALYGRYLERSVLHGH